MLAGRVAVHLDKALSDCSEGFVIRFILQVGGSHCSTLLCDLAASFSCSAKLIIGFYLDQNAGSLSMFLETCNDVLFLSVYLNFFIM